MNNSEKFYLNACKKRIEEDLGFQNSKEWKQRDYDYLSKTIFNKTNVLLSVSTLKRIWKEDENL